MRELHGQVVAVTAERDAPAGAALPEHHVAGLLVGLTVPDGDPSFDDALDDQLEALKLWWPVEGDDPFHWLPSQNPDESPLATRGQVEAFLESCGVRDTGPELPLVVFVSAHGLAATSGRHYLKLPYTSDDRLLATALPTSQIVCAALDSLSEHVLVILNMCESSAVQSELQGLLDDLSEARKDTAVLNVLGTAIRGRSAMGKDLARLLTRAHQMVTTSEQITRQYLTMSEFTLLLHEAANALEHERPARRRRPAARIAAPEMLLTRWEHKPTLALPNPGYVPEPPVVEPSLQEVAVSYRQLEYWLEKASGRLDRSDAGWYFAGREDLNFELIRFLRSHRGVKVVTGNAGSGKSALLGRLVTLSDRVFRISDRYATALHGPADTIPQVGDITAAVSAHHRTAEDVLKQLLTELDGRKPEESSDLASWQNALEEHLLAPGPPITVVIDSLDEAYEPKSFASCVLAPFIAATRSSQPPAGPQGVRAHLPEQAAPATAHPRRREVRLLLGVRSTRNTSPISGPAATPTGDLLTEITELCPAATILRTDENPDDDIRSYVKALLAGQPGWSDAARSEAALTISDHAPGSFLTARLAVEQLRTRQGDGPQLLRTKTWLDSLHKGLAGLLLNDLTDVEKKGTLQAGEALALLRATAFALGRGIAWGAIWPTLTEAVLQKPLNAPDEKIQRLLKSPLAGYLISDYEDDRVVYRPAHEQLAQILRRWPADLKGST
ncbi:AAA family ATPase [Streptomyces sp. NPDC040750]|uniref:AAA family ATPase n=1 Tax=Streptomyces sp. NPDC040750 TaxID=3154491 RepID=UPI0033E833EF